jgi:diphthamide biosynthesis protein 3
MVKAVPDVAPEQGNEASKDHHALQEEGVYELVDIEDMDFDEATGMFYFECPCGDRFQLGLDDIEDGEDIAYCPSCTLKIRVRYNPEDFADSSGDEEDA